MLLAGDELGHTQQGNNNAYCQDNELTWLDWSAADHDLAAFVGELIALRQEIPVLTNGQWWTGQPDATGASDVAWLNPAGHVMTPHDWNDGASKAMMIRLAGDWLLLVNGSGHQVNFSLPEGNWRLRLSSAEDANQERSFVASARSVTVLIRDLEEPKGRWFKRGCAGPDGDRRAALAASRLQ
jgi:glycogen operon protein